MKVTQNKPPYSMTGWLTCRENACQLRVTEGTGPGRQNSFRHHCGSIWRVSQKDRDVGVIDRSKKVPGGWKGTDGPSVMSCLLWGLSWATESLLESLRTSGSGDSGDAWSPVYLHTPGALIQSTAQIASKPGPKFL